MRFHCVMVVRDEGDVIEQTLLHLLGWADGIYILDLESTDDTWDRVMELSRRDRRVVPFKQEPLKFNDPLRGYVFDQFRGRFDPGDWVLRADADEFYHIPPPQFVKDHLRPLDTAVWLQWYYFRLTRHEVADYESGKVDVIADRTRPISDRRRHYKISEYAEPRMFRYRRAMAWPEWSSFPLNAGFVSRSRIPIRHYPHRDPTQMQARFRLRNKMMSIQTQGIFGHWTLDDWRAEVVDEQGVSQASLGEKRGLSDEAGIDTGPLHFWEPGTELKELHVRQFTAPPMRRIVQRLIHPAMLPVLDARRKQYDRDFHHPVLPEEVRESLKQR
jgi:hypothetical protein